MQTISLFNISNSAQDGRQVSLLTPIRASAALGRSESRGQRFVEQPIAYQFHHLARVLAALPEPDVTVVHRTQQNEPKIFLVVFGVERQSFDHRAEDALPVIADADKLAAQIFIFLGSTPPTTAA